MWSAEHETILASLLEKAQQYTTSEWPVKDSSSLPDWLSHTLKEHMNKNLKVKLIYHITLTKVLLSFLTFPLGLLLNIKFDFSASETNFNYDWPHVQWLKNVHTFCCVWNTLLSDCSNNPTPPTVILYSHLVRKRYQGSKTGFYKATVKFWL